MNKIKLTRIAPLSAGKIMCFMYFVVGVLAAMLICIAAPMANPGKPVNMVAAAGIVIGYPIVGFIGGVIGAAIYNLATSCLGGMEIQLSVEEHSER
ncbi:MAG TPA: hypothetical protein VGJ04_04075 [Pirellulales bacterium]|jgi:hypothetical protein